jgi:hypothetical protein
MASFPRDMFDEPPADLARVGAHRGPTARGTGWITFAWAALATGVLVLAGVFAISFLDGEDIDLSGLGNTPAASATPTAEPISDPSEIADDREVSIAILNGTAVEGLERVARKQLRQDGWPITSATDADSTSIQRTRVQYKSPDDEDVARGVAIAIGAEVVRLTPDATFGGPIAIVLGTDYAEASEAN